MDVLFPVEGSPAGFGYIDVCKDPQKYIDLLDQAILNNAMENSVSRWFIRGDGGVNEEEFADFTKRFVHMPSGVTDDILKQITVNTLPAFITNTRNNKIEEMKETSGNRDVSNGGTTSGATAASAIAALQEAGGKLSRDMIASTYDAYEEIVEIIIELIRQFYDIPRQFRIVGEGGAMEFVEYSNANIAPQHQGMAFGQDMGYRLPVFDIEVQAQKESAYTKMSQNELAIQMYQLGVFNPQLADQTLMLLDMMDFKGKDAIVSKVQQNGTMLQQIQMMQQQMAQMAQIIDGLTGGQTNTLGAMAAGQGAVGEPMSAGGPSGQLAETNSLGEMKEANSYVAKAKASAQAANQPR